MNPMILNYIIMLLSGGYLILGFVMRKQNVAMRRKPLKTFLFAVLFLMAAYATIKGVPINQIQSEIESLMK